MNGEKRNIGRVHGGRGVRPRRGVAAGTAVAIGLTGAALTSGTSATAADPAPFTSQVSVRTGGFAPGWGTNGGTGTPRVLSADGRYVVLAASGPVVAGQKQLSWQIVRRDRQLGTTTLISRSSTGVMGDGHSYDPSVSADGQVIAFRSSSTNLVPGDTNRTTDIFVHDARTGVTTRASVTSAGEEVPTGQVAGDNVVGPPTISADGRWVGFTSRVKGYTKDDTTGTNAYLHDRETRAIEVVSRHADGAVASAHVATPVTPSAHGHFVAFQSLDNLVGGAGNAALDVFVRDRRAGRETTTVVGGHEHRDLRQSITPDGRYIVFDTGSGDVVAGDANGKTDVVVHDRQTRKSEIVSLSGTGDQGNGGSSYGSISDDGRYVTFLSAATNLVPGDTNNTEDVFRRDRQTGETVRVNLSDTGAQSDAPTMAPAISGNGAHVAFNSYSRLSPTPNHGYQQVFVRDFARRYPALNARIGALPAKVYRGARSRITVQDILTGPALAITWQPVKGKTIGRTAAVTADRFTLVAPRKLGKYAVTISYAGQEIGSRVITVARPTARPWAKKVRAGKALPIRTAGLATKQKVVVRFVPRGGTVGRPVQRAVRVNAKGVAAIRAPRRAGKYRVIVRGGGVVLRKAPVRVR